MENYYGLVILLGIALFLNTGQCSTSCKGQDGEPGVKGIPGRNGLPGAKGEKGEPAVQPDGQVEPSNLAEQKGDPGSRGPQGDIGPEGYPGNQGTMGQPGPPGQPGPDAQREGGDRSAQQDHSAFSVIRTEISYPQYDKPVTYQKVVVNKPEHFDKDTGFFTCQIPGVYYFTFHSMAKVSMCLRIASDALEANKRPGFCDYYKNYEQGLSGGVVIRLTRGQKVWLESFRDEQTNNDKNNVREKQIIFNGFMIFSDA